MYNVDASKFIFNVIFYYYTFRTKEKSQEMGDLRHQFSMSLMSIARCVRFFGNISAFFLFLFHQSCQLQYDQVVGILIALLSCQKKTQTHTHTEQHKTTKNRTATNR